MRQYKTIACIHLILFIINLALALPSISVQETRSLSGDVVHDAITILAKRDDETDKKSNVYLESLSRKQESSSVPPLSDSTQLESDHGPVNGRALPPGPTSSTELDYGLADPPQGGSSTIQEVSRLSPGHSKEMSFDHLAVLSPGSKAPSFDRFVALPDSVHSESSAPSASLNSGGYMVSSEPSGVASSGVGSVNSGGYKASSEPGGVASFGSMDSGSHPVSSSPMMSGRPKSKSFKFLRKLLRKFKFWRRISGPNGVARSG